VEIPFKAAVQGPVLPAVRKQFWRRRFAEGCRRGNGESKCVRNRAFDVSCEGV